MASESHSVNAVRRIQPLPSIKMENIFREIHGNVMKNLGRTSNEVKPKA